MRMGKLNAISGALREPVTIAMLSIIIFVQVVVFDCPCSVLPLFWSSFTGHLKFAVLPNSGKAS